MTSLLEAISPTLRELGGDAPASPRSAAVSAATRAPASSYHQLTIARRSVGLTSRGRPFRRTPNYTSPADRQAAAKRRHLASYHRRARRLLAAGLTTRGTPRKRQMSARDLIAARRLEEPSRIRNWVAQRQAQLAVALADGNYAEALRLLPLIGQALQTLKPTQ